MQQRRYDACSAARLEKACIQSSVDLWRLPSLRIDKVARKRLNPSEDRLQRAPFHFQAEGSARNRLNRQIEQTCSLR